jgi:hypothetical protein
MGLIVCSPAIERPYSLLRRERLPPPIGSPEALANRLGTSAHVNEMIASAIHVDPRWSWKNVSMTMQSVERLTFRRKN